MDEGQCFRCGRVPRLCGCSEGVKDDDELRPPQRRVLEDLLPEHCSDRGCRLAYAGTPVEHPVLTCELYSKWYALYLVEPDKTVRRAPLDLHELEQYAEGASVLCDHCWNPYVLQRLADAKDWLIDDLSFDLLVGRWFSECATTSRPTRGESGSTSARLLRDLHEAFENVIIQGETKRQRAARQRVQDFLLDQDVRSSWHVEHEAKAYSECSRRFKYRLLKDGNFIEQERTALEMGVEIHTAIETLQKYGFDFLPVGLDRLDRQKLIDSLTFELFQFEEAPNESEYPRSYRHATTETEERVRAGAVVRLKDGDVYFVGNCNAVLGVCEDCRDFEYENIAEIAYLWKEESNDG